MAIFIVGMKCGICDCTIESTNDVIGFPPFVPNKRDPLYMFHDAVFHKKCFEKYHLAKKVQSILKDIREKMIPANKKCFICDGIIENPDDYAGHGYLTNFNEELACYNFRQYHKTCYLSSNDKKEVERNVKQMESDGLWEGNIEVK